MFPKLNARQLKKRLLEANGFVNVDKVNKIKPEIAFIFLTKQNVAAYIIGSEPLENGLRILGAHVDSPRLDLKENPIYENKGFALGDTHYYGGIKKYQWTTIPLALVGVVCKKDGTVIDINIGDNPNDPVVGVTDLLIHLASDQMEKSLGKAIEGENLDITLGSMPLSGVEKEPVKTNVLKILKEKYDIEEEDFVSAEIEIVPAGPARDYGLDRSMIAAYGHDDRSCAFTSLMALLDTKEVKRPLVVSWLIKKIGSVGATGAPLCSLKTPSPNYLN